MKTITAHERKLITAAIGEGLTPLPAGVLEKDVLITEVLHSIAEMDTAGLQLVFCGGTCLSKAHGLIERMSEDVDFKVVVPAGLSRSARSRQLGRFKRYLAAHLAELGFTVPEHEITARDENSYVSLNLHYESRFPAVASLRSEIKVELNDRPPVLPTVSLPVRTMLDVLINAEDVGFYVECVGVQETLAEKVLSFLRRTAEARAGRHRADYDDRLVRHLYDVLVIARRRPHLLDALPHKDFQAMVRGDAAQYRNQYPEFEQDPVGEMRGVLSALHVESRFEQDYGKFVDELVFGEPVPYAEARQVFAELADRFLSALGGSCKVDA